MTIQVLVLPADQAGCGEYRLKMPALAANEPGVEITVVDGGGIDCVMSGMGEVLAVHPPDCDVLVIQRPLDYRYPRAIELLQRVHRIPVVVDVDDRLDAIDPRHAGYAGFHPASSPRANFAHLAGSCKVAALVTVSTPALADVYGAHGRVRVLPNCVPSRLLDIDAAMSETIGWPGWTGSHPDDLTVVRAGVANVVRKTGWGVRVVGPGDDVARQLGVPEDVVEATGFVPFDAYPEAVAAIGVGIAPLRLGAFASAKSRLKPLEMAALGVPVVMSPTPDYLALAAMGAGIVAEKPKDWERELLRLVRDDEWWSECSAMGRAVAATQSIEGNAWRWVEAWTAPLLERANTATG